MVTSLGLVEHKELRLGQGNVLGKRVYLKVVPISGLLVSILLLAACDSLTNLPFGENRETGATAVSILPSATPFESATATLAASVTSTEASPDTPSPVAPTRTPVPTATSTPVPARDLSISAAKVFLYPASAIYAGDLVTIQLWPYVPDTIVPTDVSVHINVNGEEVSNGPLGGRSHLSGEVVGLFEWVWNTNVVETGTHQIEVILDRDDAITVGDEDADNNVAELSVVVRDPDTLPGNESNAIWKTAEIDCCRVHVVSRTAADRDLPELLIAVGDAVEEASTVLGEQPRDRFDIYLVDRVIGQGGYAGSEMVVSYLDRDYATNSLAQVLVHEVVHLLDRQFAPQRLAFLAEGLAVWASGGHYKPEDVEQSAAALLELDEYVPLVQLVEEFYPIQHEIGYMEAAGLVSYLVDSYGWSRFRTFYGDATTSDGDTAVQAVELNLREHFGIGLAELESDFRAHLKELPLDERVVADMQSTIKYYDIMRKYQRLHDPTAYFMLAWLPSPRSVRENGNPADLTRHPESALNVTLEVMLQAAGEALRSGDFALAEATLDSVERVLDNGGHFVDPFSVNYWNVVQAATMLGYEVQSVTLTGDQAVILVAEEGELSLAELHFVLQGQEWVVAN
jgi:hypothetical protein